MLALTAESPSLPPVLPRYDHVHEPFGLAVNEMRLPMRWGTT
jgi:hypothetical protein